MFTGLKFVFTGGISARRAQIFTTQVKKHGGSVYIVPKVPAMFRKRGGAASESLPADVTHIIVEEVQPRARIGQVLGVGNIDEQIPIVPSAWLEQCLEGNTVLDIQTFIADISSVEVIPSETQTADEPSEPTKKRVKTAEEIEYKAEIETAVAGAEWQFTTSQSCAYRITHAPTPGAVRVAAFDLDGTLIVPASGKAHPKSSEDWRFWHPSIPDKLRNLAAEGYHILIFTNQKGGSTGKGLSKQSLFQRIELVLSAIAVPIDVFVAFEDDIYRKPCPGIWNLFRECFQQTNIDVAGSCFVGDAAGRQASGTRKRDFSASDLKFAHNIGLPFFTPEQYFLSSNEKLPPLDPVPANKSNAVPLEQITAELGPPPTSQEIALFVGPPASGKSTLAAMLFPAYARVNQDTLKTKKKCMDVAAVALRAGQSVVVDNTNKGRDIRAEWIALAHQHHVSIRCIVMDVTKELCFHLNKYRSVSEVDGRSVPNMAIHGFFKNFEAPSMDEGFQNVQQWQFRPILNDEHANKYLMDMYLV